MRLKILPDLLTLQFIVVFWMGLVGGKDSCDKFRCKRMTEAGTSKVVPPQTQLTKQDAQKIGTILKTLDTMENKITPTAEQRESEQLTKLLQLPHDYNKFELPVVRGRPGQIVPIRITVGIRIRNIRGIDVLNEEIGMELDLVTHWTDFAIRRQHRQKPSKERVLDSGFLKQIWWPNLVFSRTVSAMRPDLHGSYSIPRPVKLTINPSTGEVEMSTRIVLKLYCPMNFKFYPADTQTCDVRLRSYAQSTAQVDLRWHEHVRGVPEAYFYNRKHPNYYIHMHTVNQSISPQSDSITSMTTNYTYLQFSLSTRRKLSFHVMQTYAPSIFLVVITWLTFFIPMELLEARIGISMTILLTLTAMFGSIKEYTPQVSYVKAIDTWMLACMAFVFLTLFEFTLLMYLRYVNDRFQKKAIEATLDGVDDGRSDDYGSKTSLLREHHQKPFETHGKVATLYQFGTRLVEAYGFLTVSIGFFLFNSLYWPWLIGYSNYGSFNVSFVHNEPIA